MRTTHCLLLLAALSGPGCLLFTGETRQENATTFQPQPVPVPQPPPIVMPGDVNAGNLAQAINKLREEEDFYQRQSGRTQDVPLPGQ